MARLLQATRYFGQLVAVGPDGLIRPVAQATLGERIASRRAELNPQGELRGEDEPEMSRADLADRMTGPGKRDDKTIGDIERGEIAEPPTEVIQSLETALRLAAGTLERLVDRQ